MAEFSAKINDLFSFMVPVSDFLWSFPSNIEWFSKIPVIGHFSFAIVLLLGTGIYFSIKLAFPQFKYFKSSMKYLLKKQESNIGISNFSSFMLGSSMRIGAGNVIGVTSAIMAGGPGALFWMWVSGLFGMATAFVEGTLSQIFKKRIGSDYVGGLMSYGMGICGNHFFVAVALSILYILYSSCCLPAQGKYAVDSIDMIVRILFNNSIDLDNSFNITICIFLLCITAIMVFAGIKKVAKIISAIVPAMTIVYVLAGLIVIIMNIDLLPRFFYEVFVGAFNVRSVFGGMLGAAILNGVKRGLISNEAGQGTTTLAAGLADSDHPVEQGILSSFAVFFDTILICTVTGFLVVMAGNYLDANTFEQWSSLSGIQTFMYSLNTLLGQNTNSILPITIFICFGFFAYTTLVSMISFSESALLYITNNVFIKQFVRVMLILITAFGVITELSGYNMGNMWAMSDLGNIVILYINVPILYLGLKYVKKSLEEFK